MQLTLSDYQTELAVVQQWLYVGLGLVAALWVCLVVLCLCRCRPHWEAWRARRRPCVRRLEEADTWSVKFCPRSASVSAAADVYELDG